MPDIINSPEYPWEWNYQGFSVSANVNLTMSMIIQYPEMEWGWAAISRNPGITMQDMINRPEYPWDWEFISYNPNLTMSMIIQYPDKKWDWLYVSRNSDNIITIQYIISHPEYPWDWNEVLAKEFRNAKSTYLNNQLGRVLLVSMLDDYNTDTCTPLDNTLLVLYNDYHVSCILPCI